jgi:hypothetical protein
MLVSVRTLMRVPLVRRARRRVRGRSGIGGGRCAEHALSVAPAYAYRIPLSGDLRYATLRSVARTLVLRDTNVCSTPPAAPPRLPACDFVARGAPRSGLTARCASHPAVPHPVVPWGPHPQLGRVGRLRGGTPSPCGAPLPL